MRICVLGSEGQIGKPLCSFLEQNGHSVDRIDIKISELYDLRRPELYAYIEKSTLESDIIIFLAFDVGGSKYLKEYESSFKFIHNNIEIMSNVFSILKDYKKKFIFASSQMSNMIHSNYGILKLIGERYTSALNGITVRFWNVFGKEPDDEKAHVITDFINMAKKVGRISMITDGKEQRQFLHTDDCSEALLTLIDKYDELDHSKYYDITSFHWSNIWDVASIVSMNFKVPIFPGVSLDTVQQDKRNEPNEHILKYWQPKLSLKQGIEKVING